MKKAKTIIILFLLCYSFNLIAQDSLLQTELTFYPFFHYKKLSGIGTETFINNNNNKGPSFLVAFPLRKKINLSIGLIFSQNSMESYFNDSTQKFYPDPRYTDISSYPLTYIYHYKYSELNIGIPIFINYKLLQNTKFISFISSGIEFDIWSYSIRIHEIYPIEPINKEVYYNSGFNSLLDETKYNFNISLTIKYFPLKHFGILIKPFATYNLAFDKYSLQYGLGVGICYR